MTTQVKSRAREVPAFAVFALALFLSPCSTPQQANKQNPQTPAQSSSPSADSKDRRGADSRWWIRVRGRERTAVFTEDGVLKKELPRMPQRSELSPDGSRMLEVRFVNGRRDLFVSDADGSHARRIVRGVSFEDEAHWSRDGTRILYASSDSVGDQVFEADVRGKVLRKFIKKYGVVSVPRYTPDGRVSYILKHFKEQRPPHPDNFVLPKHFPADIVVTDGTSERAVVEGRLLKYYAWEPSGQRLAFSTYEDGGLIITRDLASGAERVVRPSDIDERLGGLEAYFIRWRPDGGAIAFTLSFSGGRGQDAGLMFGETQLLVLYSDGHATRFDVEKAYSIFDWIPADDPSK